MANQPHHTQNTDPVYEPQEDSLLMQKAIRIFFQHVKHARDALDLGTGSGILAIELSKHCSDVVAADINPEAVDSCFKKIYGEGVENVTIMLSDLFSSIHGKFDLIVFNPPYLPHDPATDAPDIALSPGPKGNELILRFLKEAKQHLKPKGSILLLFSSLSGVEEIMQTISEQNFGYEQIADGKHFMEELYVYWLWRK